MKLFPAYPTLWTSLLVLWVSQGVAEDNSLNVCEEDIELGLVRVQDSTEMDDHVERTDVEEKFICLLYPTNILNCSWSFDTSEKDFQLSVHMSFCDGNAVPSRNISSVERVGSLSLDLSEHEMPQFVILHLNMSQHNEWKTYTDKYDMALLEVLSPPQNISASIKNGALNITWDVPHSRSDYSPRCFTYELDMGDQEKPKTFTAKRFYIEPSVDPSRTYKVRMRTVLANTCHGSPEWSDWSQTVTVEQSAYKLNPVVIISISLGLPMILLAVLLLVRYQRVTKILFPPIPRPPAKYKYFLEKNDAFNFFHPAPPAKPEEEITEVEEAEPNTGKSF
ncbi:granulocyte-macrophage colony-stimulating factor receptor subunit alpha-like [Acanthochromis polyacanthus]|uniref:granulocyte-macrophage colony-stimulating factor receptor subunit alpha-like n=1 Tax=Acanthochromis polyacanthus TaxID=80966 RepID=UPI002233F4CC|nr:granulocyte-macrophage colony-stimulating factor receptor subunit alpha-like [Acanthochromis polyacanthus]